jgi:hypothetical protein
MSGMSQLEAPTAQDVRRSDRVIGSAILVSAVRCTLQYVLLPFVLPFFGLGDALSAVASLVLEGVALLLILFNIRRLWHTSWRTRYLVMGSIMIVVLTIFLALDIQHLLAGSG